MIGFNQIQSFDELNKWFEEWARKTYKPTVKNASDQYVDLATRTAWECISSFFASHVDLQESEKRNYRLTVDQLCSLMETMRKDDLVMLSDFGVRYDWNGEVVVSVEPTNIPIYSEYFHTALSRLPGKYFWIGDKKERVKANTEIIVYDCGAVGNYRYITPELFQKYTEIIVDWSEQEVS